MRARLHTRCGCTRETDCPDVAPPLIHIVLRPKWQVSTGYPGPEAITTQAREFELSRFEGSPSGSGEMTAIYEER